MVPGAKRFAVYNGRIIEEAPSQTLFANAYLRSRNYNSSETISPYLSQLWLVSLPLSASVSFGAKELALNNRNLL